MTHRPFGAFHGAFHGAAHAVRDLLIVVLVLAMGGGATGAESTLVDAAGKQPRAAVGADGTIHIVYGIGSAVVARASVDGGTTFGSAVEVARVDKLMLGMRRGPQIAVDRDAVVVAAIGAAGDLVSWRSTDAGKTWTGPVPVNDQSTSAREGLFSMTAGGGAVWATWLDLRDGKTDIRASCTTDRGITWSPNRLIYQSPDGSVCECCQPTIAADATGAVTFMWRNQLAGSRDLYISTLMRQDETCSAATKLGSGTWRLAGCPMDGGGIAVAADRRETVWRREGTVYATSAGDCARERSLGPGRNPAVAIAGAGVLRAWQRDRDIVLSIDGQAPMTIGAGGFPMLAAAPGTSGPTVLAWEGDDGVRLFVIPR